MNIRQVALELTAIICHELGVEKPEEIIEIYKKCYQGALEAEGNAPILD